MSEKIRKNQEYVVEIVDNGYKGEGIAKIDNFTVFVPNTIKGETVKIAILKVTSSYCFAKIIEIIKSSEFRIESDCNIYDKCGGCNLRHIKYEQTLKIKKEIVENSLSKNLEEKIIVKDTIGMDTPYFYRNKLQYPFGIDEKNNSIMGIFAERTHNIIETDNCLIQNKEIQEVANNVYEFIKSRYISIYNEKTKTGIFRHIVIKIGIKTNEIMVVLVLNKSVLPYQEELIEYLKEKHKNIKTIVKNINSKDTNVILGDKNEVIYGDGYISDYLCEYKFKISPMSFYQVNPVQTEILYDVAIKCADLTKADTVFDLYCGIGTIGIFAAKHAKKVIGIEVVEQAVIDAKENSKINNIDNIEFLKGEVEKILPELIEKENIIADVIFVDPPRKGLDDTTIDALLKVEVKKIVYISCNPATLARDLSKLSEKYDIKELQPVDMFPWTSHVECVSLLTRKDTAKTQ